MSMVQQNLKAIMDKIRKAAPESCRVTLVAVSKLQPKEAIQECYDAGHRDFGENYFQLTKCVQELRDKANALKESCVDVRWHYIGAIQSNKIPQLVKTPNLYCIQTLASEKHCVAVNEALAKDPTAPKIRVFVQVNTSKEEEKNGLDPISAISLAQFVKKECSHLIFSGFMTIGSVENSGKVPNPDFNLLVETRRKFAAHEGVEENAIELSMGMSHDFETAITQGSNVVRVGTAIFGSRQ